jgi:hypothetical protein
LSRCRTPFDNSLIAPSSSNLVPETRLVEMSRRRSQAADDVRSSLLDADAAVGVEHAGAKFYRGQMAFADGSQAHHEPSSSPQRGRFDPARARSKG